MESGTNIYLWDEEQHQESGRALQQEHRGLLEDTLIQEEHTGQMPEGGQAGFVGPRGTWEPVLQFGSWVALGPRAKR